GRASGRTCPRQLRTEQRARSVALLDEIAIARITAADVEWRRPTKALHDLTEKRGVREQIDRRVRPVHREAMNLDVPAKGVHASDVVKLESPEPARHWKLPRDQGVLQLALPAREVDADAIAQDAEFRTRFPLRRHFGLQIRIS